MSLFFHLKVDEMSNIINNKHLKVFTSNFIEYKGSQTMFSIKPGSQIILVLKEQALILFHFDIDKEECLNFVLFEVIEIKEILTIVTKKISKHIITLNYKSYFTKQIETLMLNFITDTDSKYFISIVKGILDSDEVANI